MNPSRTSLYGFMAEFGSPEELLRAVEKTRQAGYSRFEAYSPFPIEGLYEACGRPNTLLPALVFLAGLTGAVTGFGMQWYATARDYPLNIGGRPLASFPSYIPITFELTILFAALTAFFLVLVLNRLPKLYHPVFNAPNFERASQDRFFLCIEQKDRLFRPDRVREFLNGLGALNVSEVPS